MVIFLTVVCFAAFGRIAGNDFINYDDNRYITENDLVKSGINLKSIQRSFSSVIEGNWHPLTLISHMLDWKLYGANASGHHLTSLCLHIGACIFLFLFLSKTTHSTCSAAFAVFFFALHPLRVESVAWAAERKDVLSMFFGMAALLAYSFYAETRKLSYYFSCFILFALALMSKPMLVTLPFILLLLDYWPLQRLQKATGLEENNIMKRAGQLTLEKIPFFCLAAFSCMITFWAQNKEGSTYFGNALPFVMRFANAVISYTGYLVKLFWPADLAVFYPYQLSLSLWELSFSALLIMLITITGLYYIKRFPFIFVGWCWYLGTLVPVIGLVQVGEQAMADRYTYLPSIGIGIMLSCGMSLLLMRQNLYKKVLIPAAMLFIAILSILTWKQCGYWKNSIAIFNHVLDVTHGNYLAHNNLGYALMEKGAITQAIEHFDHAVAANRNYVKAYYNRGNAYAKLGQHQHAIEEYNEAIRQKPDFADAYSNRGVSHSQLGHYELAIKDLNNAIRVNPDAYNAYYNLGVIYATFGQYQRAIENYSKAIFLKPDSSDAYYNRGILFGGQGRYGRAIDDFSHVIRLKPDFADAYNNRGYSYFQWGREHLAIEDYTKAIGLKSNDAGYHMNRAAAYIKKRNYIFGCRDAQKACEMGNCRILESAKIKGFCP